MLPEGVSWTVLAVSGVLVGRIALKPPFRRDLAALPHLAVALASGIVVGGAVAVWLLTRFPVLVHLTAAGCAVGMAFLWWRARPGYGRHRKWPPGSLGIGASLDAIDNRSYYSEQAALYGPIFKMSQFGRPVLCVVGLTRGRDLLQAAGDALEGASLPYNRLVGKGVLRYMSRETHRRERPLFRTGFSSWAVHSEEERNRAACREMLDSVVADTAQSPDGIDVRAHLMRWTVSELARGFFGLRGEDSRLQVLDRSLRAINLDLSGGRWWRQRLERAFADATDVLRQLASAPAGDQPLAHKASILRGLIGALPESRLDDSRLGNLFSLFRLGVGDLSASLNWVLYQLTEHPEWQAEVRAAGRTSGPPNGTQPPDVASRIVLETLRLEQSEFIYRRVVRPIARDGFEVPAGWILRICVQESHRDPETFPDPDTFNPDRFAGRTYTKNEYAPFGLDEHGCMGVAMVLFFGRILVEELCHANQWRVTRDGPLEHGSRHRHHWRPSSKRRIVMWPLAPGAKG